MKIVCIGDSLTYGFKVRRSEVWTKLMENKYDIKVLNKGINGDSTGGMLSRFYRDVVDNKPFYVLIMGGANDLIMGVPLNIIRSNISTMVHQSYGNNIIPIIGTQPLTEPYMAQKYWSSITNFERVNKELLKLRKWIMEFSKIFNVQVIDFCKELDEKITEENTKDIYIDGLHFTPKGNEMMLNVISAQDNLRFIK
ncbi:GDSL-type esterase/lipase family protein [Maledivibacter halophilus]|uniref:Lysophospholipase L1 n=1 Tax=Maledivibacter halophilus TaxID=36842 RepID=A0A1T5MEJ4_9FIRM|nr:GDSL-type esterase/lipase family protein [Maledivibacter halophilus]SKC86328.1 Lysophospholipase L1 [Maledivibacter halophilus]